MSARPGPTELVVFDLSTGQDLFRAPGEWQPHTKWWRQITFAGRGCLMRGDENLVYYAQRSTGPAWTLEFPQTALSGPRAYRAALSVDGTMLAAVRYPLDGSAVRVVEVGTSATTARIRVPEELRDEHLRSMSFDEDCKHLAMILGDQLLAYDVASGRLLRRQDAGAHFRYPQCLSRLSGGWLVCGEPKAVVWRDDGTWGREVRVERACAAREVDTVSGRRILIETEGRLGALVRRKTGGVIDRWPCCQERSRYDADEPLYCFVAFGGRVLVRRVGPRRVVELVDLRTAQSILAIHFLPVGEQIGWIAYTPDGFWDATPGAEKHVAVFRGTEFADEKATASRRNPQLIRARIKTLCSGQ